MHWPQATHFSGSNSISMVDLLTARASVRAMITVPGLLRASQAARTFAAIRDGVRGTAMAPWPSLSDEQIADLVAYIQTLKR